MSIIDIAAWAITTIVCWESFELFVKAFIDKKIKSKEQLKDTDHWPRPSDIY